jgi:arylsulfatase A-like enzyme
MAASDAPPRPVTAAMAASDAPLRPVRPASASPASPNLLFVIVDDLSARLEGAYAQPGLTPLTPGALRLQRMGVTFTRAYTRVTLCSPSRTALLTGMRPERTRLWTIGPYWRNTTAAAAAGDYITLPQALKARGLNATGAGKVWHPGTSSGGLPEWGGGAVGGDDMPFSWSYPPPPEGIDPRVTYWECDAWVNSTGQSSRSAGVYGGEGCVTSADCVACLERFNATGTRSWMTSPCGDQCYVDPMIADYVVDVLAEKAAAAASPFAFFTGFKRPHLGFQVPDRFLELYPADVPLAAARQPAQGFPRAAWSDNGEIRSFSDVPPFVVANATFPGMLRDDKHAELRRAYYAAVSLMDDSLGRVLDALEAEPGLLESTWVVFTGDHGWELGEHGNWAKVTLQENTARVPLVIVPPTGPAGAGFIRNVTVGAAEWAFVSLLDIFPTFAEIFNLTVPEGQLDGRSLVPLLRGQPGGGAFDTAFTQISRSEPDCSEPDAGMAPPPHPADSDGPAAARRAGAAAANCTMGMSVRIRGWRYAAWVQFNYGAASTNGDGVGPLWSAPGAVVGEELYAHTADDAGAGTGDNDFDTSENENLAADPDYAAIKAQLRALLEYEFPEGAAG